MEPHFRYTEKSVVIHRDESGFGFRVGGQNPVFVDCVHENGAAWKAGVRKKDHIIKVNGTLVRSYDHQEVVKMIQNCTPFVNLTLHSPEPIKPLEAYSNPSLINNNFSGSLQNIDSLTNNSNNLSSNANNINSNNATISSTNTNVINNLVMTSNKKSHHSPKNQRLQSNNLNWLSKIEDDLFQDNLNQQQQHTIDNNIANAHPPTGVSKLVETGPNALNTSNSESSFTNSVRPKLRQNRNQSSTRDNPYYYYKSAPEKCGLETTCETANLTCSSQDSRNNHNLHHATSSTSTTSKTFSSIVRSRSSGKIRSSSSSKHKSRRLGSRIVGDFRSLTMTNNQQNSSSLSTSPSSSDLSDCDDTDLVRPEILSANTSASSIGGSTSSTLLTDPNSPNTSSNPQQTIIIPDQPRPTTRRLEIIRELVDTEKTHTERLKHLNDLLYKPIKAEGLVPMEQLKMIFSCHKTLFKIHRQIYKILLAAQKNVTETNQDVLIGRALVEIFEGELGQRLEKAASSFCACQSINTELLNRFTRKDTKAGEFLAQVANQQMLGRLGIKDLLASCFQRLTKYPLLLDNLLKATPDTCPEEKLCISRALVTSRLILTHVNDAVKQEMSHTRLRELWRKTDKPSVLSDIDINNQHIIHEGPLTLRLNRRSFEVYVMLLTQYLVIFTREGQDKFKLKFWTLEGCIPATQLSPILCIDEHLATRDTATDENGFYLLCKNKIDSRIYQFASQSPAERAEWKEKIHMVQQYNYPIAPEDDNTLQRYRELIPLATSSNTPNNIEQHSQPTT